MKPLIIDLPAIRRVSRALYLASLAAGMTPGQARRNVERCRAGLRRAK